MCRALAYLGPPLPLCHLLHEPDNALITQSIDPKQLHMLNLAGFGFTAWLDDAAGEPLEYRSVELPVFDKNLRSLASYVAPNCVLAHVRGIAYRTDAGFGAQNLHPFRFPNRAVALAHNGDLAGFSRMKASLFDHIDPEVATHLRGSTDSEWVYALFLSQLADRGVGLATPETLFGAARATIEILREVRAAHDLSISSSLNLFVADRHTVLAVRYTFDFGRYPLDPDRVHESNARFLSLWYTTGAAYERRSDRWTMTPDSGEPQSILFASEPLSQDTSAWVELPAYSAVAARRGPDGTIQVRTRSLEL